MFQSSLPKNKVVRPFILFSILIHLVLFLMIHEGFLFAPKKETKKPETIWVNLKQPKDLPKQIADIPKPKKERRPDQARAQALYDQTVKEETVRPTPLKSKTQKGEPAPTIESKLQKKKLKEKKAKEDKIAIKTPAQPKQKIPGIPEANDYLGAPQPSADYLSGFKVGNRTYINTQANPQIAYFVELKRKFRLTWNPSPSIRNHITEIARGKIDVVVGVSVSSGGELANLIIIRSSGLESYDYEGMRTVRSSAPFSAPSSHLRSKDGMLHMAWTFTVYL